MRACGSCFFAPAFKNPEAIEAQCMNRPPVVLVVSDEIVQARPWIRREDFCAFFHHHREERGHPIPAPPAPPR